MLKSVGTERLNEVPENAPLRTRQSPKTFLSWKSLKGARFRSWPWMHSLDFFAKRTSA